MKNKKQRFRNFLEIVIGIQKFIFICNSIINLQTRALVLTDDFPSALITILGEAIACNQPDPFQPSEVWGLGWSSSLWVCTLQIRTDTCHAHFSLFCSLFAPASPSTAAINLYSPLIFPFSNFGLLRQLVLQLVRRYIFPQAIVFNTYIPMGLLTQNLPFLSLANSQVSSSITAQLSFKNTFKLDGRVCAHSSTFSFTPCLAHTSKTPVTTCLNINTPKQT